MQDRMNNFEGEEDHWDWLEQLQLQQEMYPSLRENERPGWSASKNEEVPLLSGINEDKEDRILDEYIERVYAGTDEDQFEPNDNKLMQDEMIVPAPYIPEYLQGAVESTNTMDTRALGVFSNSSFY